jgi:hypothetical protein
MSVQETARTVPLMTLGVMHTKMVTKKMIAGIKKSDGFLIPNFEEGCGFL